jgi:plasmid stabilization system protein ParE
MVAERFLHEIDMALELIADAPDRWPLSRGNTRRYVMSTFPYCIVYRIMKNAVQVFAVAHAKRRPQYWQDRRFEST